jgi:hypothetical protein
MRPRHWHLKPGSAIPALLLAVCAMASSAADHIIDFDRQVDFAGVKTFALRGANIILDRPEVRSTLVQEQITGAIRAALSARGLKEAQDADVIVDWTVRGQRFAVNEWGRAVPLDSGEQVFNHPWRGLPEAFVEGTLVLDLTAKSSGLLVWRGVYRNNERDSARVAHRLPDYAKKLLAEYPPRRK